MYTIFVKLQQISCGIFATINIIARVAKHTHMKGDYYEQNTLRDPSRTT